MNSETDRVTVPTNGRKPRAAAKPKAATSTRRVKAAVADADAPAAEDATAKRQPAVKVTSPELTVAVTPAQIAVGFGVIAGIILLVLGRRRRKG